jgi:hypothetical protein
MRGFLKCLISLKYNIRHDQENVALEQVYHSGHSEIEAVASFSSG